MLSMLKPCIEITLPSVMELGKNKKCQFKGVVYPTRLVLHLHNFSATGVKYPYLILGIFRD